jgi:hypothetical protein
MAQHRDSKMLHACLLQERGSTGKLGNPFLNRYPAQLSPFYAWFSSLIWS